MGIKGVVAGMVIPILLVIIIITAIPYIRDMDVVPVAFKTTLDSFVTAINQGWPIVGFICLVAIIGGAVGSKW